jgi:adenosylcobinamide-GDP ribazoletransferase
VSYKRVDRKSGEKRNAHGLQAKGFGSKDMSTETGGIRRRRDGALAFFIAWRRDLFLVLAFFTRLPIGQIGELPVTPGQENAAQPPQVRLAQAARAFPLAGLVVGLLGGVVYWMAVRIGLSNPLAALLAVGATGAATGALHEDGWADFADGLGARVGPGGDRSRKLAAMKDSHIGSFGVLALIFGTAIKIAAVAALKTPERVMPALVAAHALSRAVLPIIMRAIPLATSTGLGAMAGRPSSAGVAASLGIGLLIAFCAEFLPASLVIFIAAVVAALLVGKIAQRQFGGYTGDVLGAAEQVAEVAVLVNLVSLT